VVLLMFDIEFFVTYVAFVTFVSFVPFVVRT